MSCGRVSVMRICLRNVGETIEKANGTEFALNFWVKQTRINERDAALRSDGSYPSNDVRRNHADR